MTFIGDGVGSLPGAAVMGGGGGETSVLRPRYALATARRRVLLGMTHSGGLRSPAIWSRRRGVGVELSSVVTGGTVEFERVEAHPFRGD